MSPSRFLPAAVILAAVALAATPGEGSAARPRSVARRGQSHHHHLSHLHQALRHLQIAHTHAKGSKGSTTGQLSAAVQQLELARGHHHTNHLTRPRVGLGGAITTAAHHHHHGHIAQAIHNTRAAEKQVAGGHHQKALHDIARAEQHTRLAMHSHHHLIGR